MHTQPFQKFLPNCWPLPTCCWGRENGFPPSSVWLPPPLCGSSFAYRLCLKTKAQLWCAATRLSRCVVKAAGPSHRQGWTAPLSRHPRQMWRSQSTEKKRPAPATNGHCPGKMPRAAWLQKCPDPGWKHPLLGGVNFFKMARSEAVGASRATSTHFFQLSDMVDSACCTRPSGKPARPPKPGPPAGTSQLPDENACQQKKCCLSLALLVRQRLLPPRLPPPPCIALGWHCATPTCTGGHVFWSRVCACHFWYWHFGIAAVYPTCSKHPSRVRPLSQLPTPPAPMPCPPFGLGPYQERHPAFFFGAPWPWLEDALGNLLSLLVCQVRCLWKDNWVSFFFAFMWSSLRW